MDETKTAVPKYIANTATNTSNRNTAFYTSAFQNIESASYLRLRDLTLNYALPTDLVKKLSMSELSVYGQVNNPGYVTFEPGKSMQWYVDRAGGYASGAEKELTRIIKGRSHVWIKGDEKNVIVESGD